eukprot:m.1217316 g.1217316  ORF g.1217316 m.1217316 type:complete len:75 (+) comp24617_c1_seq20:186-410(+)
MFKKLEHFKRKLVLCALLVDIFPSGASSEENRGADGAAIDGLFAALSGTKPIPEHHDENKKARKSYEQSTTEAA